MKKIKLNISKQTAPLTVESVLVNAIMVDVPFIKAFAHKEGKYWHVCELSTGLQLDYGYSKTMQDALDKAIETLNKYGEAKTKEAIATKKIINTDTDLLKPETPIVKVSVSYMNAGRSVTSSFEIATKEPQAIFDNAIQDANVFAQLHNGSVQITRKVNSLYINYLDVKCDLVDRMYLIG